MPHTFRPHQERALAYATGNPRIALFMEMRLGKTPVAIRWATRAGYRRILVVAPISALDDWITELHIEGVTASIDDLYPLTKPVRLETAEAGSGWYLTNYDTLRVQPELCDMDWDCVILDESTRIRNPKAKITKLLTNRLSYAMGRALLSGLPNPEGPDDYFSQMAWLNGSFLGFRNFWGWRNAYFTPDEEYGWQWHPKAGTIQKIKESVHTSAFVCTQKQAGMGHARVMEKRVVPMNDRQKKAYKEVFTKFSFDYIETNFATVRDIWLARIAGGFSPDRENPELLSSAKTDEILDLMTGDLKREQVVIWFRFNEELKHVMGALAKKKIKATSFTGLTSREERTRARLAFQSGTYQVICGQVLVGKYSMNLSAASTAIYYSNSYEAEARYQSMERIAHLTKHAPLLYLDLVTQGSIDRAVVAALREKRGSQRQFSRRLQQYVVEEFRRYHGIKGQDPQTPGQHKTDGAAGQGTGTDGRQASRRTASATRIFPGQGGI